MLKGRKILLGVTGSISAYKAVYLVRLLVQKGAQVKVIMTQGATAFVSQITFSTLSKNPVYCELIKDESTGEWANHVELGLWADVFLIAPASANSIAKMAQGIADNLLLTTWLSAKHKVMVAPAMDHDMFHHFGTQKNLETLRLKGVDIIEPGNGELASGLVGDGRLAEPEEMVQYLQNYFIAQSFQGKFANMQVVVTAGPTYEELDPVRFIGNYSTGKMGYAIAEVLVWAGAHVTLISGPTALPKPEGLVGFIPVKSANEMLECCKQEFEKAQVFIMSAAVADYRPKYRNDQKIKKKEDTLVLELEKTTDILKELGSRKMAQFLVGFALETNNEEDHARMKLNSKNLDLIVLNSLNDKGAGFGHDTNKVTLIHKDNKMISFELDTKEKIAHHILNEISNHI